MARSLALAALLLLSLLWAANAWAEPVSSAASFQVNGKAPIETDVGITARVAVTGGAIITVTTTTDEVNDDGDCSLREAIQAAEDDSQVDGCPAGAGDDTVYLPSGIYQLGSGQLTLSGTITLQGSVTGTTTLDAGGVSRVLYIHPHANVVLLHLEIRNGNGNDCCLNVEDAYIGGGIVNYGTTFIIQSTIHGNMASVYYPTPYNSEWAPGGGIFNAGSLVITGSIISNNSAGGGGGIYNRGSTTISNSTIHGNVSGNRGGRWNL